MAKLVDIIGHNAQCTALQADLQQGNLAHAYLFSGRAHIGKMTVAHWFAEQILTHGLSDEGRADQRKRIEKLAHPDLLVLDQLWIDKECDDWDVIAQSSNAPQEHRSKTPPSKTNIISIDDVRALQKRLHETGVGTYRCCLISSIDRMQPAAANAFLKILEEPPLGLVFLLTTESLSSLLPTVTSRTRVLRFSPLAQKELLPLIEDVNDDDKKFIVQLAQGAPGIVKRLRADPDALREERQVFQQASSFWSSDSLRGQLKMLSALSSRGKESERMLLHLALSLRKLSPENKIRCMPAYTQLLSDLQSNAQRRLILQRFALAAGNKQ